MRCPGRLVIAFAFLALVYGNVLEDFDFLIQKMDSKSNVAEDRSKRHTLFFDDLVVETFHVTSTITSRYGRTTVKSVIANRGLEAGERTVVVRLPKTAFITNFTMEIDEVLYVGVVKEKSVAKQEYKAAVARGESASLVTAKVREVQAFDVAVNVEAKNNVKITLMYEELLTRKLGEYNNVIYADPGEVVSDYRIEVTVTELSKIIKFDAKPPTIAPRFINDVLAYDPLLDQSNINIRQTATQKYVSYEPTAEQQRALLKGDKTFTVTYDVTRENLGGELLIKDGYFVHFFAPDALPVIPKNVVFVIDVSGSMNGRKIEQTKIALKIILDDLGPKDRFNLVKFSYESEMWNETGMVLATSNNTERAKRFVDDLNAFGGTNLNQAMLDGISLLKKERNETNSLEHASMIILLTDGQPTTGITSLTTIQANIRSKVEKRFPIFCLGFGPNVDHTFLSNIANANQGISRRIYDDSDAALQLKGFYDEVASPMLAHVIIKYSGEEVSKVTETRFDVFYDGSEIVVAGKLNSIQTIRSPDLLVTVEGNSLDGEVEMTCQGIEFETASTQFFDMEKLWAYMTIKELLKKKKRTDNTIKIQEIDRRIVRLSLEFNFVTPLTSMVATKPNNKLEVLNNPPVIPPRMPDLSAPVFSGRMYAQPAPSSPRISSPSSGFHKLSMVSFGGYQRVAHSPPPQIAFYAPMPTNTGSKIKHRHRFGNSRRRMNRRKHKNRNRFGHRLTTTTTTPPTTTTETTTTTPATTTTTTTTTPAPSTISRLTTTPSYVPPPQNPFSLAEITCGKNITLVDSAVIVTPNFPDLFSANLTCVWRIKSNNEETIRITFKSMDMESGTPCARDRVAVYGVINEEFTPPTSYCGYENPSTFIESTATTVILFQSDSMIEGRGFEAILQVVN